MKCEQHDFIEIACLYHYPLTLTLKSGATIQGIARDTDYSANAETGASEECLIIESEGKKIPVLTAHIAALQANIDNPHFTFVNFD